MLDYTSNVVPAEWRISNKGTDDIQKWNGDTKDFKVWRTRIANHVSNDQPQWAMLLNFARTCTKLITQEWLVLISEGDVN